MKRGENSKRASKLLAAHKKEYQKIFAEEVKKQKATHHPSMPQAAKSAGKRYRKMSWRDALSAVGSEKVAGPSVKKPAKTTGRAKASGAGKPAKTAPVAPVRKSGAVMVDLQKSGKTRL